MLIVDNNTTIVERAYNKVDCIWVLPTSQTYWPLETYYHDNVSIHSCVHIYFSLNNLINLISLYMVLSINQCNLFKQFVNNHVYCYKVFKLKYLLVLYNNIQWKEMKSLHVVSNVILTPLPPPYTVHTLIFNQIKIHLNQNEHNDTQMFSEIVSLFSCKLALYVFRKQTFK